MLFWVSTPAVAKDITLTSQSGYAITASYQQGQQASLPVLILHGFLQTREFSTVAGLANALRESVSVFKLPAAAA